MSIRVGLRHMARSAVYRPAVYDAFRRSHVVNAAAGAGTNYKVGIKVYYGAGTDGTEVIGGITFGKVYLDGECREDFGDVRFASAGLTLLKYWMQEKYENYKQDYAIFWLQVADDLSSENKTIYVYYGKATETSLSNDAETFGQTGEAGADFDDGSTTGLTINLAGSAVSEVVTIDQYFSQFSPAKIWAKYPANPVIAVRGTKWDDYTVREMSFVIDEEGYAVREDGKYVAFYGGMDNYPYFQVGRATSIDGVAWGDRLDAPVITFGGGGSWKEQSVSAGQVVKRSSDGLYIILSAGRAAGDDHHEYIGRHHSDDLGLTWTDDGYKLDASQFQFADEANLHDLGVSSIFKLSSGTYFMIFEGLHPTDVNRWAIFGATSADMDTWAPFNSGYPIMTKTGAGWESVGVANPKLIELGDNEFVLAYNGIDAGARWDIGFAYSTDLLAWTRYAQNPVITLGPAGSWDDYHVECSALVKHSPTFFMFYYQGFSDSSHAQIGLAMNFQTRYYHAKSTAAADGWIVGKDLDGITGFMAEFILEETADASINGLMHIGLFDSATVPNPMTNVALAAMERFRVTRNSPTYTPPNENKFVIQYKDVGDAYHVWDGSAWNGVTVPHGGAGKYIIKIWDDGTNYNLDILRFEDRVSILTNPASIAKASVKAFSDGRVLFFGEGMTTHYYMGQYCENLFIRKYVEPEPAHGAWGAEEAVVWPF